MSLRPNAANGGADKKSATDKQQAGPCSVIGKNVADASDAAVGQDKQKMLLADDAGHFSMIKYTAWPRSGSCVPALLTLDRALHLADTITELNGTSLKTQLLKISSLYFPGASLALLRPKKRRVGFNVLQAFVASCQYLAPCATALALQIPMAPYGPL